MGIKNSKKKRKENETKKQEEPQQAESNLEKTKRLIKRDLDENIQRFLLNNLLMGVQFFDNYDRYVRIYNKIFLQENVKFILIIHRH